MIITILGISAAYLWAAIPSAYLLCKYVKGIDIRDYGSGNVGAANVTVNIGTWQGFFLGVFDSIGKGAFPLLIASLLNSDLSIKACVAVAIILGHNWSVFIRFTGGRGIATMAGVLLGFLMWYEMLVCAFFIAIVGRLLTRDVPLWTFITILVLPLLSIVFGREPEIVYMATTLCMLLATKRLVANWESPFNNYNLSHVLLYRLLWDRDVPRSQQWERRNPRSTGNY